VREINDLKKRVTSLEAIIIVLSGLAQDDVDLLEDPPAICSKCSKLVYEGNTCYISIPNCPCGIGPEK